MIDSAHIDLISQIINSMYDATLKLEDSFRNKNAEAFENSKRIILEFQNKLSSELR